MSSARTNVLRTLRTLCEEVHGRRYFVKRGAVNWPGFPWEEHPFAIAIMVDEESLLPSMQGVQSAAISLEAFTKIPPATDPPEVDDGTLEELKIDLIAVLQKLEIATLTGATDPVILRINRSTTRAGESYDPSGGVQGVVARFEVDF